jgi:ribosomal protein L7Ae-like RNA K-turn-binding protein
MSGPEDRSGPGGPAAARAVLDLLGLATRARSVVAGTDSVRQAVRDGKAFRVILASDTAPTQQAKLLPLLEARQVPHHNGFTQLELGSAMGRSPVAAVGITDRNFAKRIGQLIASMSADDRTGRDQL